MCVCVCVCVFARACVVIFFACAYVACVHVFAFPRTCTRRQSKIWEELRKPDEFKDARMEDFFEFRFAALPHLKLMKKDFEVEVTKLRDRFIDPKDPE